MRCLILGVADIIREIHAGLAPHQPYMPNPKIRRPIIQSDYRRHVRGLLNDINHAISPAQEWSQIRDWLVAILKLPH